MDIREYLKRFHSVHLSGNELQIRVPQDITEINRECLDFLKTIRKSEILIISKTPSKIINVEWKEIDYPHINILNCDMINDVVFKGDSFKCSGSGSDNSETLEKINYDLDSEIVVLKWAFNTRSIKIGSKCKSFKIYNSRPIEIDLTEAVALEEFEFFNSFYNICNIKLDKSFVNIKSFYYEENKNTIGLGEFFIKRSGESEYSGAKDAYDSGLFEFKN